MNVYIIGVGPGNGRYLIKESEEKIMEKITTKLPITYDNNTLLIVLGILVVLTTVVFIRIRILNKKQEK